MTEKGKKLSEESIIKRTETRRKNGWWKNPEEARGRAREQFKEGMPQKTKDKIRKTLKNKHLLGEIKIWNEGLTKETDERVRKNTEKQKGRIPWSKGLTKETDERIKNQSKKQKITINSKEWKETIGKRRLENISKARMGKSTSLKGKTYEEMYGIEKSKILKKKVSEFHSGKKISEKTREKTRNTLKLPKKQQEMSKLRKEYFIKHPEERLRMKEQRAKQILPTKDTKIEVKIQNFLKQLGITFFTHQYIKEIEHGYQCDILIPSMNLVIECDGDYWHKYPIGREIDNIRTKELIEKGFKVLRLWECEIKIMTLNKFKENLQ